MLFVIGILVIAVLPGLIWRARLGGEVRERVAELEAAGMPVRLEQLDAGLPAVSEAENAAPRYLEAARGYVNISPEFWNDLPFVGQSSLAQVSPQTSDRVMAMRALAEAHGRDDLPDVGREAFDPAGPLAPERVTAMRALIAANGAALAAVRDGAALPAARYIGSYGDGQRPDLGHLENLGPLAPLLCCHALVLAEDGRGDDALAALSDALALARSLASDGTFPSLITRWDMESEIQQALEYVLHKHAPGDNALAPFLDHFTVARREAQIRRMLEVEQGLFLARINESRRRGLLKNLAVSAGIGDLNLRAGLDCMALALEWPGADFEGRQRLEADYNTTYRRFARNELIYATFLTYGVSVRFPFYVEHLDRAAVAEVALALYRYRQSKGVYPETTEALVPDYLEILPVLASRGTPVEYHVLPEEVVVHNGAVEDAYIRFTLGGPSPSI